MREPVPQNLSACPLAGAGCQLCPLSPGAPGPAAAEGAGGQLQRAPGLPQGQDHPGTLWLPVSSFSEGVDSGGCLSQGLESCGDNSCMARSSQFYSQPTLSTLSGHSSSAAGAGWSQGRLSSSPPPHWLHSEFPSQRLPQFPHCCCSPFPPCSCYQHKCLCWDVMEMDRQTDSSEPAQLWGWGNPLT